MKQICSFLFLAALPMLAADRSLTGSWKITLTVNGDSHPAVCNVKQDGVKLTGTCKAEDGEGALSGEIQGEKFSWSHQLPYNGETLTLSYAGTFSSDSEIKGTVSVAPYDIGGDFAGTKDAAAVDK
jgi:hypothetical protein